ncbi:MULTISPECIES: cob(I)yrinic acid a,c-diamide adenosyltransferase [Ensifer]|jgi:cob(I)alamin adenosyltransferase|uniref:Corrinoid adenosyltransferase n=1 Tax=Ensifer canadensis TaxID=555315 RepID=A0AAW4FVB9_9HYPH|nr:MULTISPECIES: cob(I)yrinic acid a,c-diamide adenosyltransferase [Ensifer]AHK42227.1 putative ATP cob(I)alamin adenosyltransferase, monofunctional PduO type [Ensifer adhaerens OV14]MDP9634796.1 cob(I)alamin adenosyltransferase [Ensifer adhaerens]KQW48300.1 cob(I)yrinic acid a c-diamide adenosyltransferase [Ensifer sp. Root1252]KQW66074.1 cob(I)yrinic acid a c-diamide adenosyltransferase [Ensifer sp. Root127]KQY66291.1 cob(I)yrinic acid a c-diamide adenosyltransferase [Ensifer sp. Root142]
MVKLNKIYTRTGDNGTTGLVSGPRRLKSDLRVDAYGAVDETNAFVGLARQHTADVADLDATLMRIQNDLFDLGADLATPDTGEKPEYEPLRIVASQVTWLETEIDRLNADLEPLRSFVLPAGSAASAALHVARTVARRAERQMVALAQLEAEIVSREAIAYINRLSDFLFVAARWANDKGHADVLWIPGKNR